MLTGGCQTRRCFFKEALDCNDPAVLWRKERVWWGETKPRKRQEPCNTSAIRNSFISLCSFCPTLKFYILFSFSDLLHHVIVLVFCSSELMCKQIVKYLVWRFLTWFWVQCGWPGWKKAAGWETAGRAGWGDRGADRTPAGSRWSHTRTEPGSGRWQTEPGGGEEQRAVSDQYSENFPQRKNLSPQEKKKKHLRTRKMKNSI